MTRRPQPTPIGHPTIHYGYVWWPPVDIEETEDAYAFASDLAGVDREDVTVELAGKELSVSGEVSKGEASDVLGESRLGAPFAYSITLPEAVEAADVVASLDGGVLKLVVPKLDRSQRRKIELR